MAGACIVLAPNFVQVNLNTKGYLRIIHYKVIKTDFRNLCIYAYHQRDDMHDTFVGNFLVAL